MRIVCSAAFMMKINVRRCVAADFQASGVNRCELRTAVLPEYLSGRSNSCAERYAITERLRLRKSVRYCSLRHTLLGIIDRRLPGTIFAHELRPRFHRPGGAVGFSYRHVTGAE